MPVSVRRNFAALPLIPLTDAALMREIGLLARERIVRRTLAGRDQSDAAFQPYSASYAALKAKELGSASPVNLQVSGAMLQAITVTDVTDRSVRLVFNR